jgi:hypothetical protein
MRKALFIFAAVTASVQIAPRYAGAEEPAPSRFQSMTKSARDMMPGVPSLPSLSLPSMPDFSMPDFSDARGSGCSPMTRWRRPRCAGT